MSLSLVRINKKTVDLYRTETDFFKEGFELLPLVEEHRAHADWGAFATRLLDDDLFQWPSQGGHDDQGMYSISDSSLSGRLKSFPFCS